MPSMKALLSSHKMGDVSEKHGLEKVDSNIGWYLPGFKAGNPIQFCTNMIFKMKNLCIQMKDKTDQSLLKMAKVYAISIAGDVTVFYRNKNMFLNA